MPRKTQRSRGLGSYQMRSQNVDVDQLELKLSDNSYEVFGKKYEMISIDADSLLAVFANILNVVMEMNVLNSASTLFKHL